MNVARLKRDREQIAKQVTRLQEDLAALDHLIARYDKPVESSTAPLNAAPSPAPTANMTVGDLLGAVPGLGELITGFNQSDMIRQAVEKMEGNFTKVQVHRQVRQMFPDAKMSEQDVSSMIWRMAKKGQLSTVSVGSGGKPSLYSKSQAA